MRVCQRYPLFLLLSLIGILSGVTVTATDNYGSEEKAVTTAAKVGYSMRLGSDKKVTLPLDTEVARTWIKSKLAGLKSVSKAVLPNNAVEDSPAKKEASAGGDDADARSLPKARNSPQAVTKMSGIPSKDQEQPEQSSDVSAKSGEAKLHTNLKKPVEQNKPDGLDAQHSGQSIVEKRESSVQDLRRPVQLTIVKKQNMSGEAEISGTTGEPGKEQGKLKKESKLGDSDQPNSKSESLSKQNGKPVKQDKEQAGQEIKSDNQNPKAIKQDAKSDEQDGESGKQGERPVMPDDKSIDEYGKLVQHKDKPGKQGEKPVEKELDSSNEEDKSGKHNEKPVEHDKQDEKSDKQDEKAGKQDEKADKQKSKSDKLDDKADKHDEKADKQESKSDKQDEKADKQDEKADKQESKSDKQDEKADKLNDKADKQESKLDKQDDKADKQAEKADKQDDKADKQDDKADKQDDKADKQDDKADKQVEKADKQAEKADKQVEKADKQAEKADKQAEKADKQDEKADKQVEKADKQDDKADKQVEKADKQDDKADKQDEKAARQESNSVKLSDKADKQDKKADSQESNSDKEDDKAAKQANKPEKQGEKPIGEESSKQDDKPGKPEEKPGKPEKQPEVPGDNKENNNNEPEHPPKLQEQANRNENSAGQDETRGQAGDRSEQIKKPGQLDNQHGKFGELDNQHGKAGELDNQQGKQGEPHDKHSPLDDESKELESADHPDHPRKQIAKPASNLDAKENDEKNDAGADDESGRPKHDSAPRHEHHAKTGGEDDEKFESYSERQRHPINMGRKSGHHEDDQTDGLADGAHGVDGVVANSRDDELPKLNKYYRHRNRYGRSKSSSFLTYFIVATVFVGLLYLIHHNKQPLLRAIGSCVQDSGRTPRRSSGYKPLATELPKAPNKKPDSVQNFVY